MKARQGIISDQIYIDNILDRPVFVSYDLINTSESPAIVNVYRVSSGDEVRIAAFNLTIAVGKTYGDDSIFLDKSDRIKITTDQSLDYYALFMEV